MNGNFAKETAAPARNRREPHPLRLTDPTEDPEMRFPFFGSKDEAGPVRIPLPEMLHIGFGVYFRQRTASVPDAEALKPVVLGWLDVHAQDPVRSAIREFMEKGWLALTVGERTLLPSPPLELLRVFNPGEIEERRFHEATHMVVVSAPDVINHPRIGLWSAIAASRALAEAAGGVILDPEIPRLLPQDSHGEDIPADARINIPEHIILPVSTDRRGLAWMTSKGMGKFGLPELEIRDAPPNLAAMLMPVMNGLGHHLMTAATKLNQEHGESQKEMALGPEIRLGLQDLACGQEIEEEYEPPEGARGWTLVRLEYHPGKRGDSSFLRLVPPRTFRGEQGVWLNSLLADLMGAESAVSQVQSGNEAMEAAHQRAVAELPRVKQRVAAGLPAGDTLYIKHGFPTHGGEPEWEFMWIAVNTWNGDRIRGQLANDPQFRLDMRAGQTVELAEGEVYDWLIAHSDGSTEGGYTTEVLQREEEG
jgi:uncharacterized protein YegJ (DUF2314 family)